MSSAFFTHPVWSRLAATHLHFLWQGLLIAWLYWTITKVFAVNSARVRYGLGMAGLFAMAVCTGLTFALVEVPRPEVAPISEAIPTKPLASLSKQEHSRDKDFPRETLIPEESPTKALTNVSRLPTESKTAVEPPNWLTLFLVGTWLLGVIILGLRLVGGLGTVLWWRWSTLPLTDPQCLRLAERLSRQVGLNRLPRLAISLRATDAFSLGLWKPLIVLPAAWLLQLSPQTLESVLAHELAHIRRWDAWATLFQRVLESGLFYHPAVWWLSRQMDREREKCCDLWAVSLTGDRLQYVKALAGVAEIQHASLPAKLSAPIFATGMGGKNMQLLERVRHLLGETPRTGAASRIFAGAMVLAIPAALWVGTLMLPASAADEEAKLLAQAEGERDGDRERRDGDRERGERERDGERRDGDRPRDGERRDGDRPRGEREREGDRPRDGERRDGDRPRGEREREGDRPRDGERRPFGPPRSRDGERPRGPFPPGPPGFRREGEAPRDGEGERPREGGFRREGFGGPPQGEMLQLIRQLREEVEALRREVRALREGRGDHMEGARREGRPEFRRDGERRERERPARPEGERREGDRPRDGERRESERREGDRLERDGVAREREEGGEALERAREEAPAREKGEG